MNQLTTSTAYFLSDRFESRITGLLSLPILLTAGLILLVGIIIVG